MQFGVCYIFSGNRLSMGFGNRIFEFKSECEVDFEFNLFLSISLN